MITYGENGWIFLTGGSNNVVDTYNGSYTYSNWHCDWLQLIKDRNFFCQEMGIRYIHLIAPEKLGVYTEMIKSLNIDFHQSPSMILSKANSEQLPIINPTIYLREQSKNYKVYHKTDSHWNFKGAYSAYQLLMRNLNLETNNDILAYYNEVESCIMDLGTKASGSVYENVYFHKLSGSVSVFYKNPIVEYKEKHNLENSTGLHQGSSIIYKNKKAMHDKKIMIFGDSFSEYRPHLLTGLLAETFSEVYFIWSISIDKGLIQSYKPDILITEAAERFMPHSIPQDDFNLKSYVQKKLYDENILSHS